MNLRSFTLAAALSSFFGFGAIAQTPSSRLTSATPISIAARVDYSASKNLIAFDQANGTDRYFDVYTIRPNGTTKTCLTCNAPIAQQHNGNPSWDPTSQYILFQVQDSNLAIPPNLVPIWYRASNPGWGTNANLWLMNSEATSFWKLTSVVSGGGVLHAHWSRSGSRITWANKISSATSLGQWEIKVADLAWNSGVPSLVNGQTFAPFGNGVLYETHSFSPDDNKILFSAGTPGDPSTSLDLYLLDLMNGSTQNLTNSVGVWDEHAHYTPDGTKIVWASSAGITLTRDYFVPFLDYWIMNADGTNRLRLTYFNTPGYPESYPNGLVCADFSFSTSPQLFFASLEKNMVPLPGSSMQYELTVMKLKAGPGTVSAP